MNSEIQAYLDAGYSDAETLAALSSSEEEVLEPPDPEEEFWNNWKDVAPAPWETDVPQIASYWTEFRDDSDDSDDS